MSLSMLASYASDSEEEADHQVDEDVNTKVYTETITEIKPFPSQNEINHTESGAKSSENITARRKKKKRPLVPPKLPSIFNFDALSMDFESKIENILPQEKSSRETKVPGNNIVYNDQTTANAKEITSSEHSSSNDTLEISANVEKATKVFDHRVLDRNIQRHLYNGGDVSSLNIQSNLRTISAADVIASSNQLADDLKDERSELESRNADRLGLSSSSHPIISQPGAEKVKFLNTVAGRKKHQIGTLVSDADDYKVEFERKQKKSRTGMAGAACKYGW